MKDDKAQFETLYNNNWSKWKPFPDPEKKGYLYAPYGCGVYQLRNVKSGKYVLFGKGRCVASRMSSLHVSGCGTRKNDGKKDYVTQNLHDIEYRTMPFDSEKEAKAFERFVKEREEYVFGEKTRGR